MILGIGNDIIDIRRVEQTLERFGDRFTNRVFTELERAKSDRRRLRAASYAKRFAEHPELFCTITQRIVHGNWVVDHELVTGVAGRPRVRAVATYEVRNGLIQNVWFLPVHE